MRIVLLPGLDGTGDLFAPFLEEMGNDNAQVLPLPMTGKQDYVTLTTYVEELLPNEPFILVAESFSGPIAARICLREIDNLKGIFFVATFLSNPNPFLLSIVKFFPLKFLAKMPFSSVALRKFLLGNKADEHLLNLFRNALEKVPSDILKARLRTLETVRLNISNISIPTCYIFPDNDRLISKSKVSEFKACFNTIEIKSFEGPHFILQSNPFGAHQFY